MCVNLDELMKLEEEAQNILDKKSLTENRSGIIYLSDDDQLSSLIKKIKPG